MALLSGLTLTLGPVTTDRYLGDPKRLCFLLSRYKFAGKMLKRCRRVADIGCGDGIGTASLVSETKADIVGIDFDEAQIAYANGTLVPALAAVNPGAKGRLTFRCLDFSRSGGLAEPCDGIVSLDVIEHIARAEERAFLDACCNSLSDRGVGVIGTPNDYASQYGSKHSHAGHINLFTPERLHETLERHFARVFVFSMNDEVIHTGFDRLAHYLMALVVK
jgi:2-polyprenyl-3-methyl-5-hydroxy-6-metoxy-1,4-benzoquinol methylase